MIEKKDIFRKIGGIITELNDQYKYLSNSPENLNDLELELFVANSHFLSDHIEILRKLNQTVTPVEISKSNIEPPTPSAELQQTETSKEQFTETKSSPSVFEFDLKPQVDDVKPVENIVTSHNDDGTLETNVAEEVTIKGAETNDSTRFYLDVEPEEDEHLEAYEPDVDLQQQEPVEVKPVPEPVAASTIQDERQNSAPVVNEVIIEEKTITVDVPPAPAPQKAAETPVPPQTLNERISAQQEAQKTISSSLNRQQISDLKAIISLNDKLLFIKDLFNGYSLAYSEAIELVNRYNNFEAADNFLKTNYAVKNNWASKQDTVDKLYELLNRRFAK